MTAIASNEMQALMDTTTAAATQPRHDMYQPIHKALRAFMAHTLQRVGALDITDADDRATTLAQADQLLQTMLGHLAHENAFVHPALDAAVPGSSERIAYEHVEHDQHIRALQADVAAVRSAPTPAHALALYHQLALFVADNFEHMQVEETRHNAVLWAHYSDAELQAIEGRLLASIAPPEMLLTLRWMLPAINPQQRAALMGGLQLQAPPPVVDAMLDGLRPVLDDKAWAKLMGALGRPVAPGLITA